MFFSKRPIAGFIILALTLSFSFLLTDVSPGALSSTSPKFMDLESSINELRKLVEEISPGIVMIAVYDISGEEVVRGSGFFIDSDGRIVTNAFLFREAYSAKVLSESGIYENVTILKYDTKIDLALIKVNANNEPPLELDLNYQIKPGDRVVIIGKKDNWLKTATEGLINSVTSLDDVSEVIKVENTRQLARYLASKDGPLLNMSGDVIGVTTHSITDHPVFDKIISINEMRHINAISINVLKSFLEQSNRIVQLHHSKSRVWTRWFKKKALNISRESFLFLYEFGFTNIILGIFVVIIIISLIQWIYKKIKKRAVSLMKSKKL